METGRTNKADTEWFPGVWLGPANSSSETLIGTKNGVIRASSVKRFGMTEKWDVNAILDMQGTPQKPDPTKPGLSIPVQIRLEPEVPFEIPNLVPARSEEGPRRPYIVKKFFEMHGYTEGCEGCSRLSANMKSKRPHSDKCRERMYQEMKKTDEGKKWLEGAEGRVDDYLEKKLKEDHGDREVKRQRRSEEASSSSGPAPEAGAIPDAATQDQDMAASSSGSVVPPDDGSSTRMSNQRKSEGGER